MTERRGLKSVLYETTLVNNTDEAMATLTAATASATFGPFYNPKAALRLAINVSAIAAGSLTVALLGYDQASQLTYPILTSAALTAPGLVLLEVGPLVPGVANQIVQDYPPVWYELQCTVVTGPVSATIGAHGIGA